MHTRTVILGLILANTLVHVGGSVPALGDSGQSFINQLKITSLDPSKVDGVLRGAASSQVEDYAATTFGFTREDLKKLDAGYMVLPRTVDMGSISPLEVQSIVAASKAEISLERARARQAVMTSVEAVSMQQYMDGLHDATTESYEQVVERSTERIKEQIKEVTQYFKKFPSIATACT